MFELLSHTSFFFTCPFDDIERIENLLALQWDTEDAPPRAQILKLAEIEADSVLTFNCRTRIQDNRVYFWLPGNRVSLAAVTVSVCVSKKDCL